MQQITPLLQKIQELSAKTEPHVIDIDLMLDYTRTLYAQLLEQRGQLQFSSPLTNTVVEIPALQEAEPTQDEQVQLTQAIETQQDIIEEEITTFPQPADVFTLNLDAQQEPTLDEVIAAAGEERIIEVLPPEAAVKEPAPVLVAEEPKIDIRRGIGINDKYQFISELFSNDKEAYENVLSRINQFENYPMAVNWLDEVHTEYKWDDENPTVNSFYDTLNHFFASR